MSKRFARGTEHTGLPITACPFNNNVVQFGADIAIEIDVTLKLIQELASDGIDIDHSIGVGMLCDYARSI
jgi:hypothetical protein